MGQVSYERILPRSRFTLTSVPSSGQNICYSFLITRAFPSGPRRCRLGPVYPRFGPRPSGQGNRHSRASDASVTVDSRPSEPCAARRCSECHAAQRCIRQARPPVPRASRSCTARPSSRSDRFVSPVVSAPSPFPFLFLLLPSCCYLVAVPTCRLGACSFQSTAKHFGQRSGGALRYTRGSHWWPQRSHRQPRTWIILIAISSAPTTLPTE